MTRADTMTTQEVATYLGTSAATVRSGIPGLIVVERGRGRTPTLYDRDSVVAYKADQDERRAGRARRPFHEAWGDREYALRGCAASARSRRPVTS